MMRLDAHLMPHVPDEFEFSGDGASSEGLGDLVRLWHQSKRRLLRYLRHRMDRALSPRLDPEDILADTFVRAQKRWSGFQGMSVDPYVWLVGLARDCLFDTWRASTRGRNDVRQDVPFPDRTSDQVGFGLIQTGTTPSDALARKELRERVRKTMRQLRVRDREILWLHHFEQFTFREVAEVIRITENAASVRYSRALRRFRHLWGPDGPDG